MVRTTGSSQTARPLQTAPSEALILLDKHDPSCAILVWWEGKAAGYPGLSESLLESLRAIEHLLFCPHGANERDCEAESPSWEGP